MEIKLNETTSNLDSKCNHVFTITITTNPNVFSDMTHLVTIIEQCKYCYGIRVVNYKSNVVFNNRTIESEE